MPKGQTYGNNTPARQELPAIQSYRTFGRTGFRISDIGCGPCTINNDNVLRETLKTGVNVIDTAEGYLNGNNERMVGRVLEEFDRDKLFLISKVGVDKSHSEDDIVTKVEQCLERLQTDYLDGLTLWHAGTVAEVKNIVLHAAVERLKTDGKVRYLGVSCHGSAMGQSVGEPMDEVIGAAILDGRYDYVLFVYNFIQKEMGEKILEMAAKYDIGTLVMKSQPAGGFISIQLEQLEQENMTDIPMYQNFQELLEQNRQKSSAFIRDNRLESPEAVRDASIRFVLDHRNVHSVLISFQTFDDILNYVRLSGDTLNPDDLAHLTEVKENFGRIYCRHACGLCETACPHQVPVNTIYRYHHYFLAQGREKYAMEQYRNLQGRDASICSDCEGFCEKACPFNVLTRSLLKVAHKNLGFGSIARV